MTSESFLAVARNFCTWVESSPCSPEEELHNARNFLLGMTANILSIRCEGFADAGDERVPRHSHEKWQQMIRRFEYFPFQYYRVVFDPFDFDTDEICTGDVCDDLADIYFDISNGLGHEAIGRLDEGLRYCAQTYRYHWGHHASSALRAIEEFICNRGEV